MVVLVDAVIPDSVGLVFVSGTTVHVVVASSSSSSSSSSSLLSSSLLLLNFRKRTHSSTLASA